METQLLNAVKSDSFGVELSQKLRKFLTPVLNQDETLQEVTAKKCSYFIVKFLREAHGILDKSCKRRVLVDASMVACEGLRCLKFGYFEDQVTMGKILHFILIKLLNYSEFTDEVFKYCDILLELLVQMDQDGNLPDTKRNTPLATNSCLHLGNAFLQKQKVKKKKSDYKFLTYALKFHSLVEVGNSVFDKFSSAVKRELYNCEDVEIVRGIVELGLGLLRFLVKNPRSESEKCGRESGSGSMYGIAALTSCFTLNYKMADKLSEILKLVDTTPNESETLKILEWYQSNQKSEPKITNACKTESEMYCRTEVVYSILNQTTKLRNKIETMFIENAKTELSYLMDCDKSDKKANERRGRYTQIASNICTTYKNRLARILVTAEPPKFRDTEAEIDEFKTFVLECVEKVQTAYFLKRLQELAYTVLKFAQSLKESNLSSAIEYFEKSVEILEVWLTKSQKCRTEIWTVHHELSWMYLNEQRGEDALNLLEKVVVENQKNSTEIAGMYVKCKKHLNLLTEKRFLTSKMKEKDPNFSIVARSEFQSLKKCKIVQVENHQMVILEKLLKVEKEPMDIGYLLLERAIILWSKSEFQTALGNLNEALNILENSGGSADKDTHLARAFTWKYVMEKASLQSKYKIFQKQDDSDNKPENDDTKENEQNSLRFKDSFMLIDEHKHGKFLVKALKIFEEKDEITSDSQQDLSMMYGIFTLNGQYEMGLKVAKLMRNETGRLLEAQALYETRKYQESLDVVDKCKDQNSVDLKLVKSKVLLALGRVKEGYGILEPMTNECMKFPTRSLGYFMSLLSEYQRLPLAVLGVPVTLENENKNPIYLVSLSLQCLEQSFCKATDLETDAFGNWTIKVNLKNSTLLSMTSQFQVLNDYLEALLAGSRRYAEIGESKHAKTYLHDALGHSLRFCLPKWTARILVESANLSLLEGRVSECEEKLRRAHLILNLEFTEIPETEDDLDEKVEECGSELELGMEETKKTGDRASDLLCRFGFDMDDDVIQTKSLKSDKTIAKQQARSLACSEPVPLNPANHEDACETCVGSCSLKEEFSLARINLEILASQSECFVQGGSAKGAEVVDQSLNSLQDEYRKRFANPDVFKDIVCKQKLSLAKSDTDKLLPICEQLAQDLSAITHQEMIRCFQILAEAYYLLGSQSLDEHFVKPSVIGTENEPIKMTLAEKLLSDDENVGFQNQMQQEAKDMKVMNEKPIKKNGRKKRVAEPELSTPGEIEIKPVLPLLGGNDVMMTPESRVSNVNVIRKARGRMRRNLNMDSDESSPALTVTDAPRRGRKLERKVLNSYSSTELLKAKVKPVIEIESPTVPAAMSTAESPGSVASEDLNQLLDAMTLEESPSETKVTTSKSRAKKTEKTEKSSNIEAAKKPTKKTSKAKTSTETVPKESEVKETKPKPRARKNALSEETPKPATAKKTRATRSRAPENLRTGVKSDSRRLENENLIGEFRPETSELSPAFRDFPEMSGFDFPEVETLRGPTQNARSKRKVLMEMSPCPNVRTSAAPLSAKPKIGRVIKQDSVTFFGADLSRNYLEKSHELLRHHPMTSLYRRVCLTLGLMTSQSDPWSSAFYFNEASCVAYRHEALLAIQKKRTSRKQAKISNETEESDAKVEESVSFPKDVEHFKQMIQSFPADWTIVQLSIMTSSTSTNHMIVTRLRANQTPLVLQCPGFAAFGDGLLESFEETIIDSRMRNSNCEDRIRWWTAKRMFSKNVQETIEKLENQVFGCWKGLLLGCYGNSDTVAMVTKKAKELLTKSKPKFRKRDHQLLEIVLESSSYLKESQIAEAVSEIFPDQDQHSKILIQIQTFKNLYPMTGSRDPLVLILDKNITNLPLENMPIIESKPVVRSLSVYALYCQHLMSVHEQNRKLMLSGPEMTNVSYILDPDHNLPHTRDNFQSWFSELGWLGTVGKCPSRQEFEANLTNTDMMLYLGHGSGQRYFDRTRIQKLQCRAAVVLMGCSSAALRSEGSMAPKGMVMSYLLARSPFIMGNLWDVTDGDIDRFTKALLEYWLSAEPGTKLYSAMQHAREACRLRYLTGGAPVMYGLPL